MSKKLKGHKPACKCVGCSAVTRARGLARIRGGLKRKSQAGAKFMLKMWKAKAKNPAKKTPRRAKRHSNPKTSMRLVGTRPTLYLDRGARTFAGRLHAGPQGNQLTILGKFPAPQIRGMKISRIDYDNKPKALRAYGKSGRFRHDFQAPVRVVLAARGRIVVESSSRIWKESL